MVYMFVNPQNIARHINKNDVGTGILFNELILSLNNKESFTIQDLRKHLVNDIER